MISHRAIDRTDTSTTTRRTAHTSRTRITLKTLSTLAALACSTITGATAAATPASLSSGSLGSVSAPFGSLNTTMNRLPDGFDLQAHRGGIGLHTESSPYSFAEALSIGVTTLELDTQLTKDGQVVVTHDRQTNPQVCTDTAPATPDDPQFPYVGKYVKDLTLAQLRTLDCGSLQKPGYPQQVTHPGSQMMLLSEVFELVADSANTDVRFNIETKIEAGAPEETAPRDQFVPAVLAVIAKSGMANRVTIQSFDWGALRLVHALDPSLPLIALTNGDFLQVGQPGPSPWTGGVDVDDFGGDGLAAAASIPGVVAYSPVDTTPQTCDVTTPKCQPYTTPELVNRAHELGLKVIPWTVDHRASMEYMLDAGVDGMITNYPDRLRELLVERGIAVAEPAGSESGA